MATRTSHDESRSVAGETTKQVPQPGMTAEDPMTEAAAVRREERVRRARHEAQIKHGDEQAGWNPFSRFRRRLRRADRA